jgi:transcriptional regulator with XRE-family HTH domain
MIEVAHSINLELLEQLKDREYRQKFFLAESSAQIAAQLIALRKKRDLNQQEVAELIGTQQPAISRIEKADYQSWSFSILRKIAGALDARIRVLIEPSEDIIAAPDDISSLGLLAKISAGLAE